MPGGKKVGKDRINRVNNKTHKDLKAMRKGNNKSEFMTMNEITQCQSVQSEEMRKKTGCREHQQLRDRQRKKEQLYVNHQ